MKLYDFQRQAVDFLSDKRSALLGDDMGLGKTPQAIILDKERRQAQPNIVKKPKTLVVTYLSTFYSWVGHFKEWNPDLRVCVIDNKNRIPFLRSIVDDSADVYICHWQVLRIIIEDLKQLKWFHIIADECHALQDRKSLQSRSLKEIPTVYKTGLSGTPAFDKPDDLWSILNWLYPDFWSSYWRYYNRHIIFTDFNGYRTIVGVAHADELQEQMAGFYIRRRKEEVLLDLPDKYYTRIEVDLHPKQAKAYESMRKDMLAWVGEHEDEPVAAPVVIAQLTRLQQFSDAFGTINKETGKMVLSDPSSKLDAVMQVLDSTDKQVVIFSQFAQVIKLLGQRLEKAGISHGLFIGGTSERERSEIIDQFQNGKIRVFAGTIDAGGIGITLTASSTVIFIDRSWSHSKNRQAEDRLHRIGQKNAVQVVDVISRGTIDAKRYDDIKLQWEWIKELLGEKEDE